MAIENIVIQAGGKGTRLEKYTYNKPKCLVPVNNLPIIFYAFKKFPKAKFQIICDYKRDVLEKYLNIFANEYDYTLVATNERGTCAGISSALDNINVCEPFMLMWSDLILSKDFRLPENIYENYVGISESFECRWSYINNKFTEKPSCENGVAGLFVFKDKYQLTDVPQKGAFVEWLKTTNIDFSPISLNGSLEVGTIISYNEYNDNSNKCRPFNKIELDEKYAVKTPITELGIELAKHETAWYKKVQEAGFSKIPKIYSFSPLKMSRVTGKNIFEYTDLSITQKEIILNKIVSAVRELHDAEKPIAAIDSDVVENYLTKTFFRIKNVQDLIPFAHDEHIIINGRKCHNIFARYDEINKMVNKFIPDKFKLIHGDITFSNLMFDSFKEEVVLLDPRGYFGKTQYYGDEYYDWAKIYYSLVGNYDQFNQKNYNLKIEQDEVFITIGSNNWEDMQEQFFILLPDINKEKVRFLHALIWVSLTSYAWEDYDSICGAFYNGLLYLNEVMEWN